MGRHKYTFFSLTFAVLFVFGSMAVMNYVLELRETQLLTESGRAEVESPVQAWDGWGNGDENVVSGDTDGERYELTTKQVEDAINSWNDRARVILHDPVAGQISMEEAIEAGERWLAEMAMFEETVEEMDAASYSINAELGVGGKKQDTGERLDAYFSFWTVTYSNQSMNATLYLNAVTGKVWGAEIKLYEELPRKLPDVRLQLFVELAGLQISDRDSVVSSSGGTGAEIAIEKSHLCAQEIIYDMVKAYDNRSSGSYSYVTVTYRLIYKQK